MTKLHRFRLEAGDVEPYFLSLELVNAKTKAKLSERFYFHLTSHQLINNFYDELEVKKQLQKQLNHQPKAIFSLSNVMKGEALVDIYAVIFIFKTLQGVSTDQISKQYNSGKKNHTLLKETQSECTEYHPSSSYFEEFQGLKTHKEPFLFSYCPIKENGIHCMKWFLPVDALFQQMGSTDSSTTDESTDENATLTNKKQSSYIDALCDIISQHPDSISFHTPYSSRECSDLKEIITAEPESKKANLIKKFKPIPGYLIFETYKFSPKRFDTDPVERLLLFGSENEKPIFSTSSFLSLEEVIQKIQIRNGWILNPKDSTQEKELQKCLKGCENLSYQNYKVEELYEKIPKFPHFDFCHLLYLSPISLNIEKLKIDNLADLDVDMSVLESLSIKKFKPKNVLVRIEFMEAIGKPSPRIISPITQALVSEISCNVLFDCEKVIKFVDEVKIALPLPIEKENHLVISFYHLVIEKAGAKRKKTLDQHGNVHKICFGYSTLPIKDIVDNHCSKMTDFTYTYNLPMYPKLSGDYLSGTKRLSVSASQLGSSNQKKYDSKKVSFVCNTRVVSTIYPNEKLLLQFFSDCAPFISITKNDSSVQAKDLSKAIKDCRKSIENLMKVPFSKVVSHFTLIMDMLLSVMCRIPDVLHTFVTEAEQETSASHSSNLIGSGVSPVLGDSNLTGSGTDDDMMKSISARFGLSTSPHGSLPPNSAAGSVGDRKSIRSSILAAKRKSVTNTITPVAASASASPTSESEVKEPQKKRFSIKNILKRKSKEVEEPIGSTVTTPSENVKRVAQPGEEGFNLMDYLKAQQEQQQEQADPVPSEPKIDTNKAKNEKLKRRQSLTERLFHRNKLEAVELPEPTRAPTPTDYSSGGQAISSTTRKSITFNTRESHNSQSDFGDFLGMTIVLFELQKTVFQVIVSMLKGAAVLTDTSERSNKLLNTYIHYVFKDIVMTQSPVYVNLIDLFTDVISKADDNLTVSVPVDDGDMSSFAMYQSGEGNRRDRSNIRKSIQDMFGSKRSSTNESSSEIIVKNRNSYAMNMSLFAMGSPVFYESLQFCWFFLDLILKSYILCQMEKATKRSHMSDFEFNILSERDKENLSSDNGFKFVLLLKELVGALSEKVVYYKDDFANFFVSSQINNQLAFFFRDLLGSGFIKPEFVFDLMESYFRDVMVKKSVTINTVKLGTDFMQILSDFPQFMELNFSNFHPKDYIYNESTICPPVKLIVNLIRDCLTKFKGEIDVHNSAIKVMRYMLTKEEYSYLSSANPKEKSELVARIYFPYVVMILQNIYALETIPDMTMKQHLKCCLWVLTNLNTQFFHDWISKTENIVVGNLIKLLALYIDLFEMRGRTKFETNSFKAFQDLFYQLNIHLIPRVTDIVQKYNDDLKLFEPNHKDLASFIKLDIRDSEGAKYHTDAELTDKHFIEYIIFIIAKMLQQISISKQKKINLEMDANTEELVTKYIELFSAIFRSNVNNTYWKWLYGALLLGREVTFSSMESVIMKTDNDLNKLVDIRLMNVLEKVYENDIIRVDKLSKLFDDSSNADNEIILDEENKIKASTLNRLVERVCNQNHTNDSKFTDTFLVTYRSFCTPETLLTLMMSYFEFHVLGQEKNTNKASLVLRMMNTVRLWVQAHSYDFNNYLTASLMHFIYQQVGRLCMLEKESSSGYINIANKIKERAETNLICNGESSEKLEKMFSRERPQPKYPSKWSESNERKAFNIKRWEPIEVARQITLLEHNIFSAIEPKEFFGLGWTKKDKMVRAPNVVHLTEQFNNMSTFVSSDIVKEDNPKKRAVKIKQWINVAWECKNLNNLNGCNSIVSALNNAGVHRLKKSWDNIKKDIESTRFQQLNELVAMTGSYKNMRDHMSRCGEGLPYIGIYLTDMVFIEDGNKDYTSAKEGSEQLINFAKRRKIAEVIERIKTQQQTIYDFIPIPFLQKTFDFTNMSEEDKSINLLSEDIIWNKSLTIEPRTQQ